MTQQTYLKVPFVWASPMSRYKPLPNNAHAPIRLQNNRGFSRTKINRIQKLVEEHQEQLLVGWNEFFND